MIAYYFLTPQCFSDDFKFTFLMKQLCALRVNHFMTNFDHLSVILVQCLMSVLCDVEIKGDDFEKIVYVTFLFCILYRYTKKETKTQRTPMSQEIGIQLKLTAPWHPAFDCIVLRVLILPFLSLYWRARSWPHRHWLNVINKFSWRRCPFVCIFCELMESWWRIYSLTNCVING